jgi:hypothetical protein
MPYFTRDQTRYERGGKVLADVFVAVFLFTFSVVCFGLLAGGLAFLLLEAALLSVDYLVPNTDDPPGNAIR